MSEKKRKRGNDQDDRPSEKSTSEPATEVGVTLLEGAGEASPIIGIVLLSPD